MTESDAAVALSRPSYPSAHRSDHVDLMHGTAVADPYRWLETADDARTTEWAATQRLLTQAERETWTTRDAFAEQVERLLGAGTVSPPYWRGDRRFITRREPGQQFSVLYVVEADGVERVLIDPMALDPSGLRPSTAGNPRRRATASPTSSRSVAPRSPRCT